MSPNAPSPRSQLLRPLLVTSGAICVGLAVAGLVVPGLPTTVFLIAASYLFARSSPRLHRRLLAHRWLGPPLRRYAESGGMTWSAKLAALAMMWVAIVVSAWGLGSSLRGLALCIVLLGAVGTAVILGYVPTVAVRCDSRAWRAASENSLATDGDDEAHAA